VEGGLFRQTWRGPPRPDGRPEGTAILMLLAAEQDLFSALHRLPTDEVWLFHLGDPVELLLLEPDGSWHVELLGGRVDAGQHVQLVVPAGTWMGGRVAEGGRWSLFSCTLAPGFLPSDYEGGDADDLCRRYPAAAPLIRPLCRPHTAMDQPSPPGTPTT
jgi:hypothetical protein